MKPALYACLLVLACCARPPSTRRNPSLLLITIDTLRADRLGAYGNRNIATPNLDQIARDGTVFEQASAAVPLTLPSHTTIFTGRYPPSHGVRDNGSFVLGKGIPTITEVLKARGYRTAAFVGSYVLAGRFGLNRGFDLYDDRFGLSGESGKPGESAERRAGEVIAAAIQWLSAGNQPFFCWIHLNDPHTPYDPPEPWRAQYAGRLYDGEVAYVDRSLGPLRALLETRSWYRDMAIAVTGDHGESLGEHRESSHGFFIYQSTLRVPLLLKLPGNQSAGKRESTPVSLVDLAPTLLAVAGTRDPLPGAQGASLLRVPSPAHPSYAETLYPRFNFGWSELQSVRDGNWKFIEAPAPELYDLAADPGEQRNLLATEPQRVERMRRVLSPAAASGVAPRVAPTDRSAVQKLRSLGYLAGNQPEPASSLPDPKQKIDLYERIAEAQRQLADGRPERAAALLAETLRIDPGIALAHHQLGACDLRLGKNEAAAGEFLRAVNLNPRMVEARFDLGLAQIGLGDFRAAEGSFRGVLAVSPADSEALCYLGVALSGAGKPAEAIEALERSLSIAPELAEAWFELGKLQLRARDYGGARASFEQARRTGFSSSQFHAEFGWLLMEQKEARGAAAEYALALKGKPDDAVLHNNLGFALASAGDLSGAVVEYRRALELDRSYARARANLANVMAALAGSRTTGITPSR